MATLTLWSKLEDSGDVESPQKGTGTGVTGSPTWVACKFNNGMLSAADGAYATFPTGANSINLLQGAVGCWIKPNFDNTHTGYHTLWGFYVAGAEHTGIWLDFMPGSDNFVLMVIVGQTTHVSLVGDQTWSDGDLIHIGVTWDATGLLIGDPGTYAAMYWNGDDLELEDITTPWAEWSDSTISETFVVGNSYDFGKYASAVIDNLKVYSDVKTDWSDYETEGVTSGRRRKKIISAYSI